MLTKPKTFPEGISILGVKPFFDLAYGDLASFEARIAAGEAFVVKGFLSAPQVAAFVAFLKRFRAGHEAGWHPLLDGCPDYHRINDEYEGSYVRGKLRVYSFHPWNEHRAVFEEFRPIFELKHRLAGKDKDAYWNAVPSSGAICRVTVNHYPPGGGYLSEHVDPTSEFAKIQTIVQLSRFGEDFEEGGVYYRHPVSHETLALDPLSEPGDLLVLSPGVRHGVLPIDPHKPLDWDSSSGRLMVIPIIMYSDYVRGPGTKSKMVGPG